MVDQLIFPLYYLNFDFYNEISHKVNYLNFIY